MFNNFNGGVTVKKGDMLECTVCGNKIEFLEDGSGPIVCCDEEMQFTSK
ncbi:MAG: desulforedoxin [Clostridia bacterium]|nr:desulforedoxin [Clostridia bacterium]